MQQARLTLTMQDIADVAMVRRPVVSAWRKRERATNGVDATFPSPVATRGRVEHFDRDDVVRWLARTERGNNPDFHADAVAAALPEDASFDDVHALLCLRALSGVDLADHDAESLVDLADEVDPDDESLFAEVEHLAGHASGLTSYVDGLHSAALGPGDALDRLQHGRLGRSSGGSEFGADAVHLLGVVTAAIARHWAGGPTALVDASSGQSGLAERVAGSWAEDACDAFVVPGSSPQGRRLRRNGLLRGLPVRTSHDGPAIVVLPVAGVPSHEAVRTIDEVQLSLPEDRVAVVVGPASLLCDRVSEPQVEQVRDAIVRTGKLRFAARLLRGLWSPGPRQALGLWVLGTRTAQRVEDRAVALADLSDTFLSDSMLGDAATDVVAALGGDIHARSFRFARVVRTSTIIAAREIVPYGARPATHNVASRAETLMRVERLSEAIAAGLPAIDVPARVASNPEVVRPTTIAELIRAGFVVVRQGARLDATLRRSDGSVRTFDPANGRSSEGFDPLELELHHPRAARTEPGDVVFRNAPRPVADVDVVGGSVVASPARILRLSRDCPIGPMALSRAINRQGERAREWRSWTIPVVPAEEREDLDAELRSINALRAGLTERVNATVDLADALIDGVSEGSITLRPEEATGD